ncbi:APC family permease [Algoriphagus zhangzhouensis]|uniref:Amino acid transporter n=1 Tax=Algoriphagus zhangzhouensis TaxID=1073327 RepID=A0A1M7ZGA5_9BACT|nr:APC family permease [Algoriphagus zhangzhouensis]TDY44763.1 amino acid:proton symporter (ABT family) [Algoriphagus zhangzhouensis]SHO63945.1 Amino acid transporter [Algoriphagus zhangzhouensis]
MSNQQGEKKIKLLEAMSIGIGGMVGGGIFAVLGLAVTLAEGGTPVAFLVAGIIALLTSYSYTKLSLAYPDKGGTVRFINEGFGKNIFSGGANNLLWICYVVMLSLYASAFGSYAPNLISITGDKGIDFHIAASFVIVFATLINYYSIKVVGQIESIAVVIKLIILVSFVGIGLYGLSGNVNLDQLNYSNWKTPFQVFSGGMVIFVAYEGFELIANAAPSIENPQKNIPRAYYYSVLFVIVLYILISIVTVGSLAFKEIAKAQDYVLAEAAKPMLGQVGFTVITVAALISTFSAINASLYGGSRVSYEISEDDELPHELTSQLWNQPVGLMITAVLTLVICNTIDLESISTSGSIGFLIVFALVNYVAFKRSKEVNGNKWIPMAGIFMTSIATIALIAEQFQTNKFGLAIALSIVLVSFLIEYFYKKSEAYRLNRMK